jgi:hypothetical protein
MMRSIRGAVAAPGAVARDQPVTLLDHSHPATFTEYAGQARAAIAKEPYLGPSIVSCTTACVCRPVKPRADRPPQAKGAPPIVVVGTEGDPVTPFVWSKALASQLSSGVLIRFDGLVDRYLISGVAPNDGTRCSKI